MNANLIVKFAGKKALQRIIPEKKTDFNLAVSQYIGDDMQQQQQRIHQNCVSP